MVHELHHDDLPVDSETLFFGLGKVGSQGYTGVHEGLERENFDSGELTCATVFRDADASAGTLADAFPDDPLTDVFRVLGEIESAGGSGVFFLLPASSQMGVVLDGGCSRWCLYCGCHDRNGGENSL